MLDFPLLSTFVTLYSSSTKAFVGFLSALLAILFWRSGLLGSCNTMTSLRSRLSKWTLNEQQLHTPKGINVEDTAQNSPRKLHKALSTTFNYLANTVRQGATYIYQEPEIENLSSCSDGGTAEETPKKHRRQSSFFLSVRTRKGLSSPRGQTSAARVPPSWMISSPKGRSGEVRPLEQPPIRTSESSEHGPTLVRSRESSECPTLVCVDDETAPTLDVQIPDSSWPVETTIGLESSSMLTAYGIPFPLGNKLDDPLMEDPFIGPDEVSARVRSFLSSGRPNPKAQPGEDTGYFAESESGADQSGTEEFSPACLKYVSPGSPGAEPSQACDHPHWNSRARSEEKCGSPVIVTHRGSSAVALKPASQPFMSIIQSQAYSNNGRLPSDVYEADAELSETATENTPSMGSRTMFEHGLADRSRRYLAVTGHNIGSDENTSIEPHFPKPPMMVPSISMLSTLLTDDDIMILGTGDIEGQELQQVSSNSDTDVSGSSPWKHAALLTQEDAYEAGMRAAGIVCPSYSRPPSSTESEHAGFNLSNTDAKPHISAPMSHWRRVSNLSDVTTSSPACEAPSPLLCLHVRSEPARQSISADISALNATDKAEIHIAGPANLGLHPSSSPALGGRAPTDAPESDSSPQRVSNAARSPSFGQLSIRSLPKSKRALRQQRKANKRVVVTKSAEIDTKDNASPGEIAPQPLISIKHFKSTNGEPLPYTGHELDAIHNTPPRKIAYFPQKSVSFAEEKEIIGASDAIRRLSAGSSTH